MFYFQSSLFWYILIIFFVWTTYIHIVTMYYVQEVEEAFAKLADGEIIRWKNTPHTRFRDMDPHLRSPTGERAEVSMSLQLKLWTYGWDMRQLGLKVGIRQKICLYIVENKNKVWAMIDIYIYIYCTDS